MSMPAIISLFTGAGGLDLGLEAVGFETRCCVELDPYSCETLRKNKEIGIRTGRHNFFSSAEILDKDIKSVATEQILKSAKLEVGEAALISGGPPCQAFSVFGRRQGMKDPRGAVVWEFVRVVREASPRAFVFENVPGLLSVDNEEAFKKFKAALCEQIGGTKYEISYFLVESAEYGIPQFRKRIIIIGSRDGIKVSPPPKTHGPSLCPYLTVSDALRGLPDAAPDSGVPNHVGRKHSNRIIRRYASLKHGQRDPKTRINKLDPNRPSFTIIKGSDNGGGKGHVHPYLPREVTPRESARIQTFPDWWEFYDRGRHVISQVGNAVPPLLAAAIGKQLLKTIFRVNPPSGREILERLGQYHLIEA